MAPHSSWYANSGREVCICGIGARTPLGFTAKASAAAVRGGISAIATHSMFVDSYSDPVAIACDFGLAPQVVIVDRMRAMLNSAMTEALSEGVAASSNSLACLIALPDARPGLPPDLATLIASEISNVYKGLASHVQPLRYGHAAGLMAVQLAAQKVAAGEVDACIVAGVDSYHDQETLMWLDRERTLMSAANRNGFPPSEAAGACLIATVAFAQGQDLPILGMISAAATAREPNTINSDEVCIGEGLSDALKGASASIELPEQAITATYCDLNGQRYRNEEFVYALMRVQEAFVDAHDYQCPADCWGDVGAASGPLFLALAINAKERGYGKGPHPLTWASSDCGYRSAVLLRLD